MASPQPLSNSTSSLCSQTRELIDESQRLALADDFKAVEVAERAVLLAKQSGDEALMAEARECAALRNYQVGGSLESALRHIFTALPIRQRLEDQAGEGSLRFVHAQVLLNLGQVEPALEEAVLARRLAEDAAAHLLLAKVHNALGLIYRALRQTAQAKLFFEMAATQAGTLGDKPLLARALCNLGTLHSDAGEYGKLEDEGARSACFRAAMTMYARSAAAGTEANDARIYGIARRNIALTYAHLGEFNEAYAVLDEQLATCAATGNVASEEQAHRLKGYALLHAGQPDEALACLETAVSIAQKLGADEYEMLARKMMSEAHEKLLRHQRALDEFKRYHELYAKLITETNERRAAAVAIQLETERARAEAQAALVRAAALESSNLLLQQEAERLTAEALQDGLTGIANRRCLDLRMAKKSQLGQAGFSLALLDIDHFKKVNDNFSHQVGDEVLRQLAQLLKQACRQDDLPARYGGEEFALLLSVEGEDAWQACERIRRVVESHPWAQVAPALSVTISIGVCDSSEESDLSKMLTLADSRLYVAKRAGRNRTIGAGEFVAAADSNTDRPRR